MGVQDAFVSEMTNEQLQSNERHDTKEKQE